MGTSYSEIQSDDLINQFNREEWSRQNSEFGFYQLWRNTKTGELCQAYKLNHVPNEEQLEHYHFRRYNQNADNFVQIRYIDVIKNMTLCYHGECYVLTEFIPIKLTSMDGLTREEGYSILRTAYRAFHTMQAFHGPFIPDEDLIGINLQGKPKIWLNKNHSKNKADQIVNVEIWQKHIGDVSQNVLKIFQFVQQKLTEKSFPAELRKHFQNSILKYREASEVVQNYCQSRGIVIPNSIQYQRFISDPILYRIVKNHNLKAFPFHDKQNMVDSFYHLQKLKSDRAFEQLSGKETNNYPQNQFHTSRVSLHISSINQQHLLQNCIQYHKNPLHPQPATHRFNSPQIITQDAYRRQYISSAHQINVSPKQVVQKVPIHIPTNPQVVKFNLQPAVIRNSVKYQNPFTPLHVPNNIAIPPLKFAQFQIVAPRQSPQEINNEKNLKSNQNHQLGSIHQTINTFEEGLKKEFYNSNARNNLTSQYHVQHNKHKELKNQINQLKLVPPQLQQGEQELDWEKIQQENQINKQTDHTEQKEQPSHQILQQNADDKLFSNNNEQCQDNQTNISPIKEKENKSVLVFQTNRSLFSKSASISQQKEFEKQTQNQEPLKGFIPQFYSKTLNQKREFAQITNQNLKIFQDNEIQQFHNEQQAKLDGTDQISFEQFHHDTSKNAENNKGPTDQSCGTLIIHDSKENIYQGVNQQKADKIIITNIKQQICESEDQDISNNHQHELYHQQWKQYQQQKKHSQHQNIEQDQLKRLQPYFNNQTQNQHYNQARVAYKDSSINKNQQQQQKKQKEELKQNILAPPYNTLHFRNESKQLCQYTPIIPDDNQEQKKYLYQSYEEFQLRSGVQELTKLSSSQDIEQYIRSKYSKLIGGSNNQSYVKNSIQNKSQREPATKSLTTKFNQIQINLQKQTSSNKDEKQLQIVSDPQSNEARQKAESLYQKITDLDSRKQRFQSKDVVIQSSKDGNDFLDVCNLEKSLEKRYSKPIEKSKSQNLSIRSPKNGSNAKGSQILSQEDSINVAALQQRLLKFQIKQSIQRQTKIEAPLQELSASSNNQLNFNELDNIVELMDRKIQQSQRKQNNKSNNLSIKQNQEYSSFNQRQGKNSLLDPIQQQNSTNKTNASSKTNPVLKKDYSKNPLPLQSKVDYFSSYNRDSENLPAGSSTNNFYSQSFKRQNYANKRKPSKHFQKKYNDLVSVQELDQKYESTSRNLSSYENQNLSLAYKPIKTHSNYWGKNTKNIEEAKRLVNQISSKFDKYVEKNSSTPSEIQKPFAKKSFWEASGPKSSLYNSYSNENNSHLDNSSKYIIGNSQVTNQGLYRKKSSYLNPILQLQGENIVSPFKDQGNSKFELSRKSSKNNINNNQLKKNSKVSYDELRNLLWK